MNLGDENVSYRVLLWGIGKTYNHLQNLIKVYEKLKLFSVVGITANNCPPYKSIDGYKIIKPEDIDAKIFDICIILNDKSFLDIMYYLIDIHKVSENQIVSYKMLQIPNLNISRYLCLKKERMSIFSNNCWGGIVCNRLGIECRSPFKNLFLYDKDYIRFLENPSYYIDINPVYIRDEVDENSKKKYPVLLISDIELHCNHSESVEDAIESWNRRKQKI